MICCNICDIQYRHISRYLYINICLSSDLYIYITYKYTPRDLYIYIQIICCQRAKYVIYNIGLHQETYIYIYI